MDGVAVEAFGLLSQEWRNLASHRCDRLGTGGRVVRFLVDPQLCQLNRVRFVESCVDTVSEQAAIVAAGAESVKEQGDQLVTPTRQCGHSPVDAEHIPIGHVRSPFRLIYPRSSSSIPSAVIGIHRPWRGAGPADVVPHPAVQRPEPPDHPPPGEASQVALRLALKCRRWQCCPSAGR